MHIETIHRSKQPRRPHFIPEWAETRRLTQADLARELDADKSVISRWFSGSTPSLEYQERLAALFACEPASLFRHPDDDWLSRFFTRRSREEIDKMKQMLEIAFPQKNGTDG
jgi:transcriptional regulator with XRE-family HTH domain